MSTREPEYPPVNQMAVDNLLATQQAKSIGTKFYIFTSLSMGLELCAIAICVMLHAQSPFPARILIILAGIALVKIEAIVLHSSSGEPSCPFTFVVLRYIKVVATIFVLIISVCGFSLGARDPVLYGGVVVSMSLSLISYGLARRCEPGPTTYAASFHLKQQ